MNYCRTNQAHEPLKAENGEPFEITPKIRPTLPDENGKFFTLRICQHCKCVYAEEDAG